MRSYYLCGRCVVSQVKCVVTKSSRVYWGYCQTHHFVMKRFLETIHRELVQGLVLMEGITTIDYLKPTTHHLVHYSEFTPTHVTLTILRVMVFEGYNKYLKEHVRN